MRFIVLITVALLGASCIDDGRPLSEWEAEYNAAVERERMFADAGRAEDTGPIESVCSVEGGAPVTIRVEVLLDEDVLAYKINPLCEREEKGTIESMTNSRIQTHVGHSWEFATVSEPDRIVLRHVVENSAFLRIE